MKTGATFGGGETRHLLVVSLIGHYERIAQYLFRSDALRAYPNVAHMRALRVRARSARSLAVAAVTMARHLMLHRGAMVGVPRSNSRAIRLLVRLFPRATYFSYSDGLGDSIHRFFMADRSNYAGHVGFPLLGDLPLIHEIPLTECIEPWGQRVQHDPQGPVLVIAKTPKETAYEPAHLVRLYERTIAAVGRHRPVLMSGTLPGLILPEGVDVRPIGSLMKLDTPLALSGAVGLPSTAFLTLVTRLPASSIHILRLGCSRTHPDAHRRIASMKATLDRCMLLLAPAASPDGAATPSTLSTPTSTRARSAT